METLLDLAFMVFGLGFFMYVIDYVNKSNREDRNHQVAVGREDYHRKLNEQREFGYQAIKKDPPKNQEPQHKKQ